MVWLTVRFFYPNQSGYSVNLSKAPGSKTDPYLSTLFIGIMAWFVSAELCAWCPNKLVVPSRAVFENHHFHAYR